MAVPDFGPGFIPSQQDNMNGEYAFSSTPGGKPGLMPKQYKHYPGGVESFEVYSPAMTTLYSQVWWAPLAPIELPTEIVKKYNGTGMAIVGWEIDQVRRTPEGDVSVPISASYNHHYTATMIGADAHFEKVKLDGPSDPRAQELLHSSGCGMNIAWEQPQYLVNGAQRSARGLPTRQALQSGNGGEYRKTYHGFSPGHALLVDSPTALQITPMQIDTWNRDAMDISGPLPPKFVPGPLPRASLAPKKDPLHSGLLECPMTTRLTKIVDGSYVAASREQCKEPIITFYECFQAAADILNGTTHQNESGRDASRPPGCSVSSSQTGQTHVFFNELPSSVKCSAASRCICPEDPQPFGQSSGTLRYHRTNQSVDAGSGDAAYFKHKCNSWPYTSLLDQKNPTCDIRYYRGGQWACKHMWSLLDADQEIPWPDRPLVFHHKYRFWVQPYDKSYHKPLTLGESVGAALLLGSPWEYDVPRCAPGVAGCSMENGTWVHTIKGNRLGSRTFVSLNNHCHAPTCLSTEVYVCPKGTALSDCNATVGKLICRTAPIYGGTGHPTLRGTRFDEPGYIAIPDCEWGSEEYGLELPIDVTGLPLHIVKRANATDGHYGEMSGGQPWVLSEDAFLVI
eukprot:TRINITY_DN62221_c0_g1_i1.p1 TRINITY_DN62221_c0_g1~~TRINITY_DN62221_c0_g1_i1.p1  ORF type:complete len:638 (-),score=78.15 TRINITY_DN62221_c0_g1_i1:87-1958(-)